jgi:hypothetical protein
MPVRATDAGVRHGDEHVAWADWRHGRIAVEPQAGLIVQFTNGEHVIGAVFEQKETKRTKNELGASSSLPSLSSVHSCIC